VARIHSLARRMTGFEGDPDELTQDVFVRAFKGLGSFKGNSSFSTWIYRIGVNTCLNRVAVKRPATESIDASPRADDRAVDPLHAVMRDERALVVRRAIEKLPPKQRATLVLRVYQELSHEEIARVLGSSVGAVKANFFHALGNLKRLLQSS